MLIHEKSAFRWFKGLFLTLTVRKLVHNCKGFNVNCKGFNANCKEINT